MVAWKVARSVCIRPLVSAEKNWVAVVLATAMDGGNAATSVYVLQSMDSWPLFGERREPN